jgi:hypothetical protein
MAVTRTDIAEQYIAYYDRAADESGFEFWLDSPLSIEEISASFAQQQETADKYPFTMTTTELVDQVYMNVFNREADDEGLSYWVGALDGGLVTRSEMIIAIVNGATGDDQRTLDNKSVIAIDYANSGLNDYDNAVSVMDGVTSDAETVIAAREQIDNWAEEMATIKYTIERDLLLGTDNDNTFEGLVNGTAVPGANADTFQEIDVTDGGEGKDTLHIISDITADRITEKSTVYNVEVLKVTQNGSDTLMVDATNFDDKITTLATDSAATASGDIFFGLQADGHALKSIANIELGAKNGGVATTVVYENDVVSSVANSAEITLLNGVAQTLTSANISAPVAIEKYTIHTTGSGNQALTINDLATKTIEVDGKARLALTDGIGFVTKIDASASIGSIEFAAKAADALVIGSKGDDTLAGATNSTLVGGSGSDNLIAGASGTVFSYFDKHDSTRSDMDHIIGYSAGSETINVTEAIRSSGFNATDAPVNVISTGTIALVEGAAYTSNSGPGTTHAYQDTTTNYLYVDLNQDNEFNSASDLVIDIGGTILAGDLIV